MQVAVNWPSSGRQLGAGRLHSARLEPLPVLLHHSVAESVSATSKHHSQKDSQPLSIMQVMVSRCSNPRMTSTSQRLRHGLCFPTSRSRQEFIQSLLPRASHHAKVVNASLSMANAFSLESRPMARAPEKTGERCISENSTQASVELIGFNLCRLSFNGPCPLRCVGCFAIQHTAIHPFILAFALCSSFHLCSVSIVFGSKNIRQSAVKSQPLTTK